MRLINVFFHTLKVLSCEWKILLWRIKRLFKNTETVSTKQGVFTVSLKGDDPISRSLYLFHEYELYLMTSAMTFLRKINKIPAKGQGAVIDIGANNGVISIGMLHNNEVEKAIAIEPEPKNFAMLQHNVKQNKFSDKIVCLPFAASNTRGILDFELSNDNSGDHRIWHEIKNIDPEFRKTNCDVIQVNSDRIDSLIKKIPEQFKGDIALMWIDVQGHEGYVFQGAKDLLSEGIPVVSEIWPYGIKRAGMSEDDYIDIVSAIWSDYWVMRRGKFIRYPIDTLNIFFKELGYDGYFENIIFTK